MAWYNCKSVEILAIIATSTNIEQNLGITNVLCSNEMKWQWYGICHLQNIGKLEFKR